MKASPGLVLTRVAANPELPPPLALVHTCLTTLALDGVSVGKENLDHVEPIFDALVSPEIEFSVLKCHQLGSHKNIAIGSGDLRVSEADGEISPLVQQRNLLDFGQLALGAGKRQ